MPKAVKKKSKSKINKVTQLEKENKVLEGKIKELKDKNITLLAEFDNYKKRIFKQIDNNKKYEGENIIIKIISVLDDIERVLEVENADSKTVIDGVDLIKNKFLSTLKEQGVEGYKSIGEKFDPDYHEAIMMKETKGKSNVVIEEYEKGYTYHDKVLRHSKVIVSE